MLNAVDSRSFYTGSANMDWRSLTQVKELGISVTGSRCLSADFEQIFDLYWSLGAMNVGAQDWFTRVVAHRCLLEIYTLVVVSLCRS